MFKIFKFFMKCILRKKQSYGCDVSEIHTKSVEEINNQIIMSLLLTHKMTLNTSFDIKKTICNDF